MNDKFKAVIKKDKVGNGVSFSVTHNGSHWTSIRIESPLEDVPQMILTLQSYLAGYYAGVIRAVKDKYLDSIN